MEKEVAWVDGWEVRQRPDGSYGVYDSQGLVEGPFGTQQAALEAALNLPHPKGYQLHPPRVGLRSAQSD